MIMTQWATKMSNIGAWEIYNAIHVKESYVNIVDAYIKETVPDLSQLDTTYCKRFRYRFLTQDEQTRQVMSGWLKNVNNVVIHTSETELQVKARDRIYFLDGLMQGKFLNVINHKTLLEVAAYTFNHKPPKVLELS
jgi:hypothetical protein